MTSGIRTRLGVLLCTALLTLALVPGSARGIELQDGRLQGHGFFESRVVAISDDFDGDYDLAQWSQVLNLEIELDIAPDGFGPFMLVSGFARINVVYDCVWTRACGLFPSADTYGDRAGKLPDRLSDAERPKFRGQTLVNEDPDLVLPDHRVGDTRNLSTFELLFETAPEAAEHALEPILDFGFAAPEGLGSVGPWRPENFVDPVATLFDRANPFNPEDTNPLTGESGAFELPFRPAPLRSRTDPFDRDEAQGIYYPYPGLSEPLDEMDSHAHDQNFRQAELEWNRGASQQDEKELKEAYIELEAEPPGGLLWARLGKQTIVWGKTELFRNQDRWNPTDLGLGPLASLEEARVGLWSARLIYSFFDVGPLDDVRLEGVAVLDPFEPTDLGICGEPLIPTLVCGKRFGLMAHGLLALGVAGERRPPAPWNSSRGLEAGLRLEWRYDRFSFAVTDFWGYRDLGLTEKIFHFERNVDPRTGRPRRVLSRAGCDPEERFDGDTAGCLGVAPFDVANTAHVRDVLDDTAVNQQLFALICGATVGAFSGGGLAGVPTSACALDVFNTDVGALAFRQVGRGGQAGSDLLGVIAVLGGNPPSGPISVLAELHAGPSEVEGPGEPGGLSEALTAEQEALLGCGPFYGTVCDTDGPDLLNAEASALFQSFGSFEGVAASGFRTDRGPQPGTIGFAGGPVATRLAGGRLRVLPGARGPFDAGYDPAVDGCVASTAALGLPASRDPSGVCAGLDADSELRHPGTGALFANELAALSWNFQMLLTFTSGEDDDPATPVDESLARDAWDGVTSFAEGPDPERCSIVAPQLCSTIRGLMRLTGVRRSDRRAAGNGRFGRRDFIWHGGTPLVFAFEKRNVVGFAMDFAEDRSKSNWGVEATWENDFSAGDADSRSGFTEVDNYNLTVSVDRPTIISFLNPNRTFFFNSQWFVSYIDGYRQSFTGNGPFTVLGTLTASTAYFQDRLLASATAVYDVESSSGAWIQSFGYRFSERFRVSLGLRAFFGRSQEKKLALEPIALENRRGSDADRTDQLLGVAPVRDLDQVTLRLRYTF